MFSYRHAFHAGNHADVLKHTVLLAVLRHLLQKDTALTVFDTHAGAGLYRLDGEYAATSGEAGQGFLRLISALNEPVALAIKAQAAIKKVVKLKTSTETLAPALKDYLDLVASFNSKGSHKVYPGSPFIIQRLLGERDKLKVFEIHPTDAKTLSANIAQLEAGRQVAVLREDGFEGIKKFLPPPARRALVLSDPSYEIKNDYARVVAMVADALTRFATGTYAVWYPIIPRPEAHDVPRKLKTLANKAGKPWLNATLTVKSSKLTADEEGEVIRPGLPASGMFIINPPHTLKAALQLALPQLVELLGQDQHAAFTVESGG
ncbi:MAG: 23S rRNA (adenine(2030)-N(6))-methyltransferase RlmJ [Gammaproteobacteria bacterium]|uniref:23S rRNA (adenine(2030)-N(6))-methyltransferase RlmJ n=1 Tax=Rhodoferax sp. TaxID=50421 RepID=UPI0017989894|nr:23S rRNA (adenine(2030)-N(6))-methyltransferase RlmJ [Rhodoferax sp.]MBU3898439.1 23S rRNA (adenine(2030)-N(6))-methyltransferase RlmJ [Gammaproteobacteria bacterium]MBA3056773.1 23S rRNA (adenine(2030)-N(6))-methyltransferase RlmJ [Rhodoferax sp.]MBU3998158.1 23S rRNA (adenine(2030)-N(6))-methyltransferase RlmJ [Gammaproteobacteria bacterium]MBU4079213.1 23S rRNA (adenine(2030)-N(6))-methyltransferase RlmJ [Gammaproteobacteria bacterium]MBU4115358.1 23S rRNA (adenine(2030)-N(6))-methyltran